MDPGVDTTSQNPFANEATDQSSSSFGASYPSNAQGMQSSVTTERVPALESPSQTAPSQPPQRFRAPQSQYFIVFSVTGIERSNARNPIIRFDAKVVDFLSGSCC